ncbi:hypothetical protein JS561_02435 [Salmonella enterica subsp. enterica serovar Infantis]|nr:hypothetical protein JS561_02435 [Salmonella enterica subsp. enterica serovar Infantis]
MKKRIGLTIRNNVKCVGIAYSGIFIPIIGFSAKGPWRGRTVELVPDEVFSEQPRVDLAGLAISGIRKLTQKEEDLMSSLKEAYFVMIFI